MKKGKKIGVVLISTMLLAGAISVGAGAVGSKGSIAQEPAELSPQSRVVSPEDEAALFAELQSREELLFSQEATENLEGPALQAVVREQEELLAEYGAYYEEFGWDNYQGLVYHNLEVLKASIEESILALNDFIAMAEADVKPPTAGHTKEETILVFEERLAMNEELLQKLEARQAGRTDEESTLKELSGEYELLYYLPGNIQRVEKALNP